MAECRQSPVGQAWRPSGDPVSDMAAHDVKVELVVPVKGVRGDVPLLAEDILAALIDVK